MRWCTYSSRKAGPRVGLIDDGNVRGLAEPATLIEVLRSPQALAAAAAAAGADPVECVRLDEVRPSRRSPR